MKFVVLLWLSVVMAGAASAQATPSDSTRGASAQPRGFCLAPQRLPRCRSYLIFDVIGAPRVVGTSSTFGSCSPASFCTRSDLGGYLAWDLGWMANRDSTRSYGASLQIGGSDAGVRIGLRARRRAWLRHRIVFDQALGLVSARFLPSALNSSTKQRYGVTGEVALGIARVGALAVAADVTQAPAHTAAALYAGVRLEAWPAVGATTVAALGVFALFLALKDAAY